MKSSDFEKEYMSNFSEQQKAAVKAVDGSYLLLAVPGSGKTTVLITRIGYMVCCKNIAARKILTVTFTVASTHEMRNRYIAKFGEQNARGITFCTINSLAMRIIKKYSALHGKKPPFDMISRNAAVRLVSKIHQEINGEYPGESAVNEVLTEITYIKNMMLHGDDIKKADLQVQNIDKIYEAYCKSLKEKQLMDYDDQLVYALTILSVYPDILAFFQNQYHYICVDESQDTSKIQHEIIRKLAQRNSNLFMVGDEDQSIYGFRAAYPDALLHFQDDYPNGKIMYMETNYRSVGNIVDVAAGFIAGNQFRYPKQILSGRSKGAPVRIIKVKDRQEQFQHIYNVALEARTETGILYRNNESALPLIDLFERNGIPYNCKSFDSSFFSHRVVTDIADILSLASNPYDYNAFCRVYYKMGLHINKEAATWALEKCLENGNKIMDQVRLFPDLEGYVRKAVLDIQNHLSKILHASAETALDRIWYKLGYGKYAERKGLDATNDKFNILCLLAQNEDSLSSLLARLEELKAIIKAHKNEPGRNVVLSTIHSSKGLEYDVVYLADVSDGILPLRPCTSIGTKNDLRIYEEERRLYYVAMTRAKERLYIYDILCGDRAFVRETKEISKRKHVAEAVKISDFLVKKKGTRQVLEPIDSAADPSDFREGSKVWHRLYGLGTVLSIINGRVEVFFDSEGLMLGFQEEACRKDGVIKVVDEELLDSILI